MLAPKDLPRLPGVRDRDYRRVLAPLAVDVLPEAEVEGWRRDLSAKARLVVLGETTIETITIDLLSHISPPLDANRLRVCAKPLRNLDQKTNSMLG
jgi:hypothetical protein